MKIGILTFYNADNYGAVLQCYALQEHLKKLYPNDEICVIDYKNVAVEQTYKPLVMRKKLISNFTQFLYLPQVLKKRKQFIQFRSKYLNLGSCNLSEYDIIYFGSDQIWNQNITGKDMTYFGAGFNGRKIGFAVSDGGELTVTDEIIKSISKFESISCREESLTNRIAALNLNVPVKTVNDPVFLLSKKQWLSIAEKPKERGYVLAYKIAQRVDFDEQAEQLGKKLGKQVIQIVYLKSVKKMFCKNQKFVEGVSPEQFLGYIADADFVITTSFHGTAFSILFEKPFYVLNFDRRNERIKDLLKCHGLMNCYVSFV